MDPDNSRLEILLKAIEGLRVEILELNKAMHRAFFVVLTVSVIFGGTYFDKKIITDNIVRGILLFGLSQILFLLVLFAGACFANQNVHAGYIRSLEKRVNKIIGFPYLIWESEISPTFLYSARGAFFWICLVLYVCIFISFSFFMTVTLRFVDNIWLSALIILEILILFGLGIFLHFEFKRAEDFSNEIFDSYKTEQS